MKRIVAIFEVDDDFNYKEYHASLQNEFGTTFDRSKLKILPGKKEYELNNTNFGDGRTCGWNDYLYEILGEKIDG